MGLQKKNILFLCLVVVLAAAVLIILLCSSGTKVGWSGNGTYISADGKSRETLDFSFSGTMKNQAGKELFYVKAFDLPSSFPFTVPAEQELSQMGSPYDALPYFVGSAYGYDHEGNEPAFFKMALDEQKGYILIVWDNMPDSYFVASRDSNVDPQVILDHFQDFLNP